MDASRERNLCKHKMIFFAILSLYLSIGLHPTSANPLEVVKQEDVFGKISEVKEEINELYKRLNVLTGPIDMNNKERQTYHASDGNVCVTKDCVAQSHKLFQNMNTSVNPCDDFYQYSCGNYIQETIIPDDKGSLTASFSPLRDIIEVRGRKLLEEDDSSSSFEIDRMSKKWYAACMNESRIEEQGISPMLDTLKKLGGWPVLEESDENYVSFKWYEQTRIFNVEGLSMNTILSHYISADAKNNSYRVIHFDQPSLGMTREYLIKGFEDKYVQSYYKYMVDSAVLLGADKEIAKEQLKESLLLEISLANLSAPREERRDATKLYNPTTIGELDSNMEWKENFGRPQSWRDYIEEIIYEGLSNKEHGSSDNSGKIIINAEEKIIIQNPSYFEKFGDLISTTEPKVVANYMAWRVVQSRMEYLNKAAQDIEQKYNKAITGVENVKARWKKCVESSGFNSFSIQTGGGAASSMYVRKFFKPEEKQVLEEMIGYVRRYFAHMLHELSWMDDETKSEAKKKLEKMDQFIAYPDQLLDKETIDGFHEGLNPSDDFYSNILQRSKFWAGYEYNRLREKIDPKDWRDNQAIALVNAFYNPEINAMIFPAGILQGSFFNSKAPKYVNFGAIGIVIGHEITHGFDDQGRRRNHEGLLKDWWAKSTAEKYLERAQCIVDQYGNFTSKQVGMPINGINSQGENIADHGGMKESYGAYLQWVEDQKKVHQDDQWEEQVLPGHDLTPRQLFWVSYGQLWCQKFRDDALRNTIKTGTHTPGEYRVLAPLSNSPDFAKDFNCPIGSPMNPEKKCEVW